MGAEGDEQPSELCSAVSSLDLASEQVIVVQVDGLDQIAIVGIEYGRVRHGAYDPAHE
jgi:hypothetical protein